MLEQLQERTFA
uniref:Squalene monooxygenase-like n=1 Tax=Rhizophora mucronata TaxID=61149 RepID=A0A2P2IUS2_RHIMU